MGAPTPARGEGLADAARPLLEEHDVALLDLDGVLYLGEHAVPHAAEAVAAARAAGVRLAYVTNNASRAPDVVAEHLTALGIPARPEDVVTSAQAAARLAAERVPAGSAVLVVGTAALADEVVARGLRPVRTVAEAGPGGPAAVVQGLSPDTRWQDLAEAAVAVRGGAVWVTGNVDSTLPTGRGPLPGNGTMVAAVATATGAQPVVAGKPEPALHEESVRRTGARRPLVVGDRLDTDVEGAARAGAASLLVLTGVADLAALLAARAGQRPSFVAPDLRGLLVAHPPVVADGDRWRCGDAVVQRSGERLVLAAPGGPGPEGDVAALRAACAAAWQTGTAEVAGLAEGLSPTADCGA